MLTCSANTCKLIPRHKLILEKNYHSISNLLLNFDILKKKQYLQIECTISMGLMSSWLELVLKTLDSSKFGKTLRRRDLQSCKNISFSVFNMWSFIKSAKDLKKTLFGKLERPVLKKNHKDCLLGLRVWTNWGVSVRLIRSQVLVSRLRESSKGLKN